MDAVIYARISRDTEGTQLGVDRQLADCRKAAHARGWAIVEEYVDNDVSATSKKPRPAYQRMMKDLAAGRARGLIVWDVDRLTRTPRELEDVIDLAESRKLALVSIGGDIDLATPQGMMTARIKGSVARHEADQMSRRIKRRIEQNAEEGRPHGYTPWGWRRVYDLSPTGERTGTPRYVIDEDAAAIIRDAARRLLAGQSLRSVARELNDSGSTSPKGNRWSSTTLKQVLMRTTNAGLHTLRGKEAGPSQIPAILPEDDWRAVVAILSDPARRTGGGSAPTHLLTGIARCELCGGLMRHLKGAKNPKTGKHTPGAYGCRDCFKIRRKASLLDEAVEAVVLELLKRPETLAALTPHDPERIQATQSRIRGIQARMAEAADSFADGDITGDQLKRINGKLRPQLEEAQADLAALTPSDQAASLAGDDAEARWAAASIDARRQVIDRLLNITVLKLGPGRTATYENSLQIEPKG